MAAKAQISKKLIIYKSKVYILWSGYLKVTVTVCIFLVDSRQSCRVLSPIKILIESYLPFPSKEVENLPEFGAQKIMSQACILPF